MRKWSVVRLHPFFFFKCLVVMEIGINDYLLLFISNSWICECTFWMRECPWLLLSFCTFWSLIKIFSGTKECCFVYSPLHILLTSLILVPPPPPYFSLPVFPLPLPPVPYPHPSSLAFSCFSSQVIYPLSCLCDLVLRNILWVEYGV